MFSYCLTAVPRKRCQRGLASVSGGSIRGECECPASSRGLARKFRLSRFNETETEPLSKALYLGQKKSDRGGCGVFPGPDAVFEKYYTAVVFMSLLR